MLGSSLRAPDDSGGSTGGVEAGVRTVALMGGTELAMSLGVKLWEDRAISPNVLRREDPKRTPYRCQTGPCSVRNGEWRGAKC
jgi:hypothetical protein